MQLHGRELTFRFPNLSRVKQVQDIFGADIFQQADKYTDISFLTTVLSDVEKLKALWAIVFVEPIEDNDIEVFTVVEGLQVLNSFFTPLFEQFKKAAPATDASLTAQ